MRQVYEYRGHIVYIDRQHRPSRQFEVFVPVDKDLWFIGEFYASPMRHIRTWSDAERKARQLVDQWMVERKTA